MRFPIAPGALLPVLASLIMVGAAWAVLAKPQPQQPLLLASDIANLHNGDLIFRRGLDVEAEAVRAVDDDHRYTHVGLVLRHGTGPVYVLNIMPGEKDGDPGGVRIEPVQTFAGRNVAQAIGVYRLNGAAPAVANTALAATEAAQAEAARHPAFDWDFDLSDARKLYCTELVWRAYRAAGVNLAPHPKVVNWPLKGPRPYISPSTLIGDGMLTKVLVQEDNQQG